MGHVYTFGLKGFFDACFMFLCVLCLSMSFTYAQHVARILTNRCQAHPQEGGRGGLAGVGG